MSKNQKAKVPEAVRQYLASIARKNTGPRTITRADSRARSARLAAGRANITPEVVARRAATRRANNANAKRNRNSRPAEQATGRSEG